MRTHVRQTRHRRPDRRSRRGLAARPSGSAGKPVRYVVQPTDTLWSIAAKSYPGDPREGIWKLQKRNHLTGTTLVPGQRLLLP